MRKPQQPEPVLTETCHLLLCRPVHIAQTRFIESVERGMTQIFKLESRHLRRIHTLIEKYADLPMDLADASLVILAEDQKDGRILSTDQRDFQAYRWKCHEPFENLLLI